ncbi:MAG: FtsQ-type POTRA domain-containing protein [Candidatus Omnitrophota bacterium]
MGRKKFKKGKKGWFFSSLGAMFRGIGWLVWKLLPVAVIAGALVYAGLVVKKGLCEDRWLRVQSIQVVPPDALSPQSIRTLEDKILGKNILLLDLKKIANTIELGPGAQSVRVVREMPTTIRVEIQKRRPVVNVQLKPGGPYAIAADDGFIIEIRPALDPTWILMEDFSEPFKEPRIGARLQNKGFAEALRFMKVFRKHELARHETVTRISLDPNGYVTVRLGEGPDFKLGRKASEAIASLTNAVYLLKTEPRENVEYMDLQYDRVAVKRKS